MGKGVPVIEAKSGCSLGQAASLDSTPAWPSYHCWVSCKCPALLGGLGPSGRAPTCHQEQLGPTGTTLTLRPVADHLTGPGGAASPTTSISAACSGLLGASGARPRSVQPAGLWLGISLGAATFGTHYLIINFLLSSTPSTPPQLGAPAPD